MRKLYIVVILMLGMLNSFAQPKEYSGQINITPLSLQQKGDSVYVNLKFDFSDIHVDSRRSISLVPVLVAPDNHRDLTEVTIKGRENYNVYQREMALMSNHKKVVYAESAPYAVLPGFKSKQVKILEYNIAVKYEPWMADAKLEMYEDVCGCGSPARRSEVVMLINQILLEKNSDIVPYVVTPYLAYAQPVIETIKQREMIGGVFLDFVVNRTDIRPDYMNNPQELKKISDMISEVRNDRNITVRTISVIGYASPEGTIAGNKQLSEGRAKALVEYLLPHFDYSRSLYNVEFGGENWQGLKESVEESQMSYRQQVLDIIESVPAEINYVTKTSRKKALMDLAGGTPYLYMLRTFFPSLRKAICKIDFEVKNFDVLLAKEIVKTHPQNLSQHEIYLVAGTNEKGSKEFTDLLEVAARIFPEDAIANLNVASAALSRRDIPCAKQYLTKMKSIPDIPEYYNTMGVLEMIDGNCDKAVGYLEKAAQMGLEEAKLNLEEVNRRCKDQMLTE